MKGLWDKDLLKPLHGMAYIGSSAMINNIKAYKEDKNSFYLMKRKHQF